MFDLEIKAVVGEGGGGGTGKSKIFSLPPLSLFFTVAHPMILISFSPHPSTAIRIKDSVDSCC